MDVERTFSSYNPAPPPNYWFDSLDCIQWVVDVYNRSIYFEAAGKTMYLPFWPKSPETFRQTTVPGRLKRSIES